MTSPSTARPGRVRPGRPNLRQRPPPLSPRNFVTTLWSGEPRLHVNVMLKATATLRIVANKARIDSCRAEATTKPMYLSI